MTTEYDYSIPEAPEELAAWLAQQGPEVRRAAECFPLGFPVQLNEKMVWVVGYSPEGAVVTIGCDPKTLTFEQMTKEVEQRPILLDADKVIARSPRH